MTNKEIKLYLDDLRTPVDKEWIVVRSYDEFVEIITKFGIHSFETLSMDHDLGDTAIDEYYKNTQINYTLNYENITEKTGYDCAKWLVEYCMNNHYDEIKSGELKFPQVYSHSANPIGAANIIGYINNFLKNLKQPQTSIRVQIEHT